uniref:helix-turn-helix domain-containing protein n=1 Tax=Pedobacter schmidteae TaxID=2201271 RepID=UPI000EACD3EB|nr:helix-turn-helix transcriptional regulator [Pedobacter schmidteae]
MNAISTNIKRIRQQQGWSQAQMAQYLEMSVSAFCKIEIGVTDINITRLKQIAMLLKVSASELMSENYEAMDKEQISEITLLRQELAKRNAELIDLQKELIRLYENGNKH